MFNRKYTSSNGGFFIVMLVFGGVPPNFNRQGYWLFWGSMYIFQIPSEQGNRSDTPMPGPIRCILPFLLQKWILTLVQKETSLWGFTHFPLKNDYLRKGSWGASTCEPERDCQLMESTVNSAPLAIHQFTIDLSRVIKWDPFLGDQTLQMYGNFEGFPI